MEDREGVPRLAGAGASVRDLHANPREEFTKRYPNGRIEGEAATAARILSTRHGAQRCHLTWGRARSGAGVGGCSGRARAHEGPRMTAKARNLLYYGDNLDVLQRYVKDETVDLVYLDPPFK